MLDISGKVLNYDVALCEAMFKEMCPKDSLVFLAANIDPQKIECKSKKLISLVPKSLRNSENILKRGFKALEGVLNYFLVIFYLITHKVDVLHFQWLPFLEISSVEKIFLCLIRLFSRKTKLILTVHNIYPHNFSDSRKNIYRQRFALVQKYFDKFVVHLQVSKKELCEEFKIDASRVDVVHHGVFVPRNLKVVPHERGEKLNLIMYGNQSYYKGTDILVDAISLLPREIQEKVHTLIVGKIAPDYYAELKEKSKDLDIEWIPEFVPDDFLNEKIMESDVIVLPYRQISQSGVLLLALNFEKPIIVSNLPSFRETLSDFSDECFFQSGNAESLKNLIIKLECNNIVEQKEREIIQEIKKLYSWKMAGQKCLSIYGECVYGK